MSQKEQTLATMSGDEIVITSGARTPIGRFQGCLKHYAATELGAHAIKKAVEKIALPVDAPAEIIMGCVLTAGLGQAPARQAARQAGVSDCAGATTVNKVCGSGMKAIMMACDVIRTQEKAVVIAGGMESMSNAPYLLPKARSGLRLGHGEVQDHMFFDGLEDAQTKKLMGFFAEESAQKYNITRDMMDDFAIDSLQRALEAYHDGSFSGEIASMISADKQPVDADEQPQWVQADRIKKLKPVFSATGAITAANASSISDGAAALTLMTRSQAIQRGTQPLARVAGYISHSQHPSEFITAPVGAIQKLLQQTGWTKEDVDLFEINEAFALVTLLAIKDLDIDYQKVNIYGGACAMGHPIGASGARIVLTLINALKNTGKKRGIASLCIGGGEATALAIEV